MNNICICCIEGININLPIQNKAWYLLTLEIEQVYDWFLWLHYYFKYYSFGCIIIV